MAQTVNPEKSVGRLPEEQQNTRPLLFREIPVGERQARLICGPQSFDFIKDEVKTRDTNQFNFALRSSKGLANDYRIIMQLTNKLFMLLAVFTAFAAAMPAAEAEAAPGSCTCNACHCSQQRREA